MEEIKEIKAGIRNELMEQFGLVSKQELSEKTSKIEIRLFEFANFLESNIVLIYIDNNIQVSTKKIINKCLKYQKIVVVPIFDAEKFAVNLIKIDNFEADLKTGQNGVLEPNRERCKEVPIECIDIAIIPGIAFDEKGGRIGTGNGFYDRLIPELPITARKVAIAYEDQIIEQIPMESHDKYVDIIISEKRIIYKI